MKLLDLFILLFVIGVHAQRRISTTETSTETIPHRTGVRGRVRFTATSDAAEAASSVESEPAVSTERRKPARKIERRISKPANKPYEVEEDVDDIPNLNVKKIHKPRVITETRFEAKNAPKTPLFVPVPRPEDEILPEDLLPNFAAATTSANTEKVSEIFKAETSEPIDLLGVSPENEIPAATEELIDDLTKISPELTTASEQPSSTENEIKSTEAEIAVPITEIKRKLPEASSTTSAEAREFSGSRGQKRMRIHPVVTEEATTLASRVRTRGRPSRRPDLSESSESIVTTARSQRVRARPRQESQTTEIPPRNTRTKTIRRRIDTTESTEFGIKGRGPSVFTSESSQELPSRSRTGRRANFPISRRGRINSRENHVQTEASNDKATTLPSERVTKIVEENTPTESSRSTNLRRRLPVNKSARSDEPISKETTPRNGGRNRPRNRHVEKVEAKQEDAPTERNFQSDTTSQNFNGRRSVVRSRKPEVKVDADVNKNVIEPIKTETKGNIRANRRSQSTDAEAVQKKASNVIRSRRPEAIPNNNHDFVKDTTIESVRRKPQEHQETPSVTNARNPANVIRSRKPEINVNIEQELNKIESARANGRRAPEQVKIELTTVKNSGIRSRKNEAIVSIVPDLNKNVIELPKENEAPVVSTTTTTTTTEKVKSDDVTTASITYPESKRPHNKNRHPDSSRRNGRLFRVNQSSESTEFSEATTAKPDVPVRRRAFTRPNNAVNVESSTERVDKYRSRQHIRFLPPIIDEQKLEVLPLFESEAKTIGPILDLKGRRKSSKVIENIASATEQESSVRSSNEIRDSPQSLPIRQEVRVETITGKPQTRNRSPITKESVQSEISEVVSVRKVGRPNLRKDSQERLKVNRQVKRITVKVDEPKVTVSEVITSSRRNKSENKPSKKNLELSRSDEVNESDNYPEPFKALIQSKLSKPTLKGSRSQESGEDAVTKRTEKVVISSRIVSSSTSAPPSSDAATVSGRVEDIDNELAPKSSTTNNPRSTRKRFSLTTKTPESNEATTIKPSKVPKRTGYSTRKNKTTRSTKAPSHESVVTEVSSSVQKQTKYHAKFSSSKSHKRNLEAENGTISVTGQGRAFSPKPPRGVYSSRQSTKKSEDGEGRSRSSKSEPSITASQISLGSAKKSNRLSSRYRKNLLTLTGAIRPTKVPAYIPTVPTPSSVKSGIEESEMEVISIDDPVNTIPSDSLINGELLTPSNPYNPSSKLFPASLVTTNQVLVSNKLNTTEKTFIKVSVDGASTTAQTIPTKTTEKPVSIIERIIYSITAISTTTSPDVTIDTTNTGPTRPSAIFKIPNKSSKLAEKTDVTFDQTIQRQLSALNQIQPSTTEKPTTVIEKILSSLSAIQATTSERTLSQVGNNINSISTTFKPIPSVSRSTSISSTVSTTFSPEVTSTLDPLVVLEQISSENTIQESTIAKLLSLLKSIKPTTTTQEHVVVVTPKTTFISSTSDTPTTVPNRDVEVFNITSNLISDSPEKQIDASTNPTTSTSSSQTEQTSTAGLNTMESTTSVSSESLAPAPDLAANTIDSSVPPSDEPSTTIQQLPDVSISTTTSQSITESSTQASTVVNSNESNNPEMSTPAISSKLSEVTTSSPETTTSTSISEAITSANSATILSTPDPTGNDIDSSLSQNSDDSTTTQENSTPNVLPAVGSGVDSSLMQNDPASQNISTIQENATPNVPPATGNDVDSSLVQKSDDSTTQNISTVQDNSTPNIISTTEPINQNPVNANSRFSEAISLSDYLSSLMARINEESTTGSATTSSTSESELTSSAMTTTESNANQELSKLIAETNTDPTTTMSSPIPDESDSTTDTSIVTTTEPSVSSVPETMSAATSSENTGMTSDTTNPTSPNPTTDSILSSPTSEASSATTEQLSRLVSSNDTGNPTTIVSTTFKIEQTTITTTDSSANFLTTTDFSVPVTIPPLSTLSNFEVSPGSVTVFSANDLSSMFNPTDDGTTVTILSRSFFTSKPETTTSDSESTSTTSSNTNSVTMGTSAISNNNEGEIITTESSLSNSTSGDVSSTVNAVEGLLNSTELPAANVSSAELNSEDGGVTSTDSSLINSTSGDVSSTDASNATEALLNSTESPIVNINATDLNSKNDITESSLINSTSGDVSSSDATNATETLLSSTESPVGNVTSAELNSENVTVSNAAETEQLQTSTASTASESSPQSNTTNMTQSEQPPSNQTDTSSINATTATTQLSISNRAGRLLAIEPEPVQNDLQTSSVPPEKDYFIFAVLPNNTIVRKRPSRFPNKNTPFVIFGVYPNNTVVQKFPNGTLIPEEPIIQVSGFDTRENPPTLPEITSNQVTQPNQDSRPDNKNLQTADIIQNTVSAVEVNQLAVDFRTNAPTTTTLPTLSGILAGKTVQAFNNIVNQTNGDKPVVYETLDVDPMTNMVLFNNLMTAKNVVFRWKPVSRQQIQTGEPEDEKVEDNTISNKGNATPEKIVQSTTQSTEQTAMSTTTSAMAAIILNDTTTNVPSTSTTAPTTVATSTQAAIMTTQPPINDNPTTMPVDVITTTMQINTTPNIAARSGSEEGVETTVVPLDDTTVMTDPTTTTTFQRIRYTSTPTSVYPEFGSLDFTTPFVLQRLLNNPTTFAPNSLETTRTDQPMTTTQATIGTTQQSVIQSVTTTKPTMIRSRVRLTTTQQPMTTVQLTTSVPTTIAPTATPQTTTPQTTTPQTTTLQTTTPQTTTIPTTTPAPITTVQPTTTMTIPPTIQPRRGRIRLTTTQAPDTTTDPATTTFISRRYTMTPTTIIPARTRGRGTTTQIPETTLLPRRFTTTFRSFDVTPTRGPAVAQFDPIISNSVISQSTIPNIEEFTVFPVYTSSLATTRQPPLETIRASTTPQISTIPSREELGRLTDLRIRENYGELSTTSDFAYPTTISPIVSTINPVTLQTTLKSINSKVRLLTDQQRKDLEELTRLEKEQQAILQQLAFLTRLNLGGGPKATRSPSNLASRVLDFAADRDKTASTFAPSPFNLLEALTGGKSREPKKVSSSNENLSVEDVLRQLNVNPNSVTPSSLSATYGQSTDAILAALLKEQGIGPSTPKSLGDQLKTTTFITPGIVVPKETTTPKVITTTRRRITTTPRAGPIMQGLNWLLNVLDPPTTTKRPTRKPTKPAVITTTRRSLTIPPDVEILSNQPTEISPVFVTAPSRSTTIRSRASTSRQKRPLHSLSDKELQSLIAQLEMVQKDPSKAHDLDFSSLNLIQSTPNPTTILEKNVVQVTNSGNVGTNSKLQVPTVEILPKATDVRIRSTTPVSIGISNSILNLEKEETTRPPRKTTLAPVRLNPVHGVDDDEAPQVRGQLINAAVNVTRAISQFLGSAIQGAAHSFQSFIGSGSRQVGNYFSSSSSSNRPG